MMAYLVPVFACATCGKAVTSVDPQHGLLVRALVQCPECVAATCINCGQGFATGEMVAMYLHGGFAVGPFCARCEAVVTQAKAVAAQAGGPHVQ